MKNSYFASERNLIWLVVILTSVITLYLAAITYYINYWPTDSYNPYIPVASELFKLPFISQMHDVPVNGQLKLVMHGKETLIIGIAIFQQLLNDFQSLYPNVLLLIVSVGVSGILLFLILKNYFDAPVAFAGYLLFTFSFWPYIYIIQGAHPPLVLMNFLLAWFLLQKAGARHSFYFFSGIFLGLMFFSSPTSPLYLPYYGAFFLYHSLYAGRQKTDGRTLLVRVCFIGLGALSVFLLFTIPHPIMSIKEFFRFLNMSQQRNNFVIYKDYLAKYFVVPASLRGAGGIWIMKYLFLAMPILAVGYLLSLLWLLKESFTDFFLSNIQSKEIPLKNPRRKEKVVLSSSMNIIKEKVSKKRLRPWLWGVILLSLSTPLAVEASAVVQFGRNYFSWFIAMICVLCLTLYRIKESMGGFSRLAIGLLGIFMASHIIFNGYLFFSDVLPSRLATTKIYDWLTRHHRNEVFAYENHPFNKNFIQFLNNPKVQNKIYVRPMQTLREVQKGYILILPITGKSILCECRLQDFQNDPALTELFNSKEFYRYVVAAFKTMASSRMWNQEEELCTYRDLIVHQITDEDRKKGFAWILDAEKLQKEWFSRK